ncbi:hypothetical protein TWF128_000618 [Orbilia oligospora]|nr:hypothetical protein TWF128_000618 [Orbilia oligospora]
MHWVARELQQPNTNQGRPPFLLETIQDLFRHYWTAHVNRCGHEQISLLKAKSCETWRFPGMETITTLTTCFRDAGLELFPCNQEVPRLRLCPGRCRDNTILRKAYYRIGTGIRVPDGDRG